MPESSVSRASAQLLARLAALSPTDAVARLVDPGPEGLGDRATAVLIGRDWRALMAHVRGADTTYPAGFAWRAAAALYHLGHLEDAVSVVNQADTVGAADADRSRLAATAAAVLWARGDGERCRELVDTAFKHAQVSGDAGAEASAWVMRAMVANSDGDRDANLQCYQRARRLAEDAEDLATQERICNNLGSRALEEGRWELALTELYDGLAINERTGHASGAAVLHHNASEALSGLGRLDEALVECDVARELYEALEAPDVALSWALRGEIQVARGNATQAAMSYGRAAALAAAGGDSLTAAVGLAGRSTTLVSVDPDEAVRLAEEALAIPVSNGHAIPVVLAGWTHLAVGDRARAVELATSALALAADHDDLPRLAEALELGVLADPDLERDAGADPRLQEAGRIWQQLGSPLRVLTHDLVVAALQGDALALTAARAELRANGVHDDTRRIAGPLFALPEAGPTASVRVSVLGGFAVAVDGDPVPLSTWPSRKARDVVKILATRPRGLSRDQLGGLLWPDADGVGNRLSIALSHVRAVFDPTRSHAADHYLRADRDVVGLDSRHVDVDVLAFTAAARAALAASRSGAPRALRLLEAAAAMHGGELFEDDPYAEWAAPERDEVEGLGRELVRALADGLAAGDRSADALGWYARLLAADPYDEPAHLAVVSVLVGLGRYGEAHRQHRTYTQRMAELGVEARSWDRLTAGGAGSPKGK